MVVFGLLDRQVCLGADAPAVPSESGIASYILLSRLVLCYALVSLLSKTNYYTNECKKQNVQVIYGLSYTIRMIYAPHA